MDFNRVQSVLKNKEKVDIFYDERPVWIQGVNNHVAKVGFIDNFEERDVFIEDLYDRKFRELSYNIKRLVCVINAQISLNFTSLLLYMVI